jgi:hypothetical protein
MRLMCADKLAFKSARIRSIRQLRGLSFIPAPGAAIRASEALLRLPDCLLWYTAHNCSYFHDLMLLEISHAF